MITSRYIMREACDVKKWLKSLHAESVAAANLSDLWNVTVMLHYRSWQEINVKTRLSTSNTLDFVFWSMGWHATNLSLHITVQMKRLEQFKEDGKRAIISVTQAAWCALSDTDSSQEINSIPRATRPLIIRPPRPISKMADWFVMMVYSKYSKIAH